MSGHSVPPHRTGWLATPGRSVLIPGSDEILVKLPFAGNRLARVGPAEVVDVGVVVGHTGETPQERGNAGPKEGPGVT